MRSLVTDGMQSVQQGITKQSVVTNKSVLAGNGWQAGPIAVYALLATTWLLIGLAQLGWFAAWPAALPLLVVALVAAVLAWWRAPVEDRWVVVALVALGSFLYTPPAEHLPLFGDGAIYPNEGAYLARTGGMHGVYEPLAALSPPLREPFYVANVEQFAERIQWSVQSYQGILYGGYYLMDLTGPTLQASRMPLSEVWFALLTKLVGVCGALYQTALWGMAALVMLYLTAGHFVKRPAALWATVLLAVSYPQIHFARAPYAEVPGQFWLLLGFYFAVRWIDERKPWQLVTVLLCWTTTWAGRVDAVLLLGAVGLLGLIMAATRDKRTLVWAVLTLPLCAGMVLLAANVPYIGATYELIALRWSWFGAAFLGLLLALPVAVALAWVAGPRLPKWAERIAPLAHPLLFAACAFVVGWSTLPNPLRDADVTRSFQEILWFSSQYLTPLFYWLVLAGIGWLCWRGYGAKELLLLGTVLSLSAVFFFNYTSAPVYPVSLRRLLGDVWPLMCILAAIALAAPWPLPGRRYGQLVLGAAAIGWMVWLSWPILQQQEAADTLVFIQELHEALPSNSVVIFETQDGDSWVGWLAAPLYSLYGDWTLLLDSDEPDPATVADAVAEFVTGGRAVYIASQHQPLPVSLLPPGYQAPLALERLWRSSLIGQTRAPYPPPYWEFAHPLYLYQLQPEETP